MRKFPFPHAGSRNVASILSVSCGTRSNICSTIKSGVYTSPWSWTLCLDFMRLFIFLYNEKW